MIYDHPICNAKQRHYYGYDGTCTVCGEDSHAEALEIELAKTRAELQTCRDVLAEASVYIYAANRVSTPTQLLKRLELAARIRRAISV